MPNPTSMFASGVIMQTYEKSFKRLCQMYSIKMQLLSVNNTFCSKQQCTRVRHKKAPPDPAAGLISWRVQIRTLHLSKKPVQSCSDSFSRKEKWVYSHHSKVSCFYTYSVFIVKHVCVAWSTINKIPIKILHSAEHYTTAHITSLVFTY